MHQIAQHQDCPAAEHVIMRIMHPVDDSSSVIRTRRTVASKLFGEGSETEAVLFDIGVRHPTSTGVLWVLWLIGTCAGLLVLYSVLPPKCVGLSVLMLPLPLVTFLLLSKDLLMELLVEWDYYIINLLQLVMVAHAVHEVQDVRSVFWAFCLPTLLVAPLTDAYPAKYRALFVQLYFIGLSTIFVAWLVLLTFQFHRGRTVLMHIGDNATLALFYIRPIWSTLKYPDLLVLLKCGMETHREEVAQTVQDGQLKISKGERRRISLPRGVTDYGAAYWQGEDVRSSISEAGPSRKT